MWEFLRFMDADHYTSHTNEVIVAFTGDASAVESAVRSARTIGLDLLRKLGSEAKPVGVPYLINKQLFFCLGSQQVNNKQLSCSTETRELFSLCGRSSGCSFCSVLI